MRNSGEHRSVSVPSWRRGHTALIRARVTVLSVAVCVFASACADRRTANVDTIAARKLVGAWNVHVMRADTPMFGATPLAVGGSAAFVVSSPARDELELAPITNDGVLSVPLQTVGADMPDNAESRELFAQTLIGDSLVIRVGRGERTVWLRGRWSHDSIVGTWSVVSPRTTGAHGAFALTR